MSGHPRSQPPDFRLACDSAQQACGGLLHEAHEAAAPSAPLAAGEKRCSRLADSSAPNSA